MYLKNNIPFSSLSTPSNKKALWVRVHLPKKSLVIGTVSSPRKMKITEHLEDCWKIKAKVP